MRKFSCCLSYALLLLPLLMEGCANLPGWQTEYASDDFVENTVILGEAVVVATREEALSNRGHFVGWREKLISAGYSDYDITDGSEVSIFTYCYAHNSGVYPCSHTGHYVAHIPPELRKGLKGEWDNPQGDLVEVRLTKTAEGYLVGEVFAIYRKSENWGNCRLEHLQQPSTAYVIFSKLMLVGPPRAMWIECDMDKSEGWQRRPVRGAPLSGANPVSEWIKLPR